MDLRIFTEPQEGATYDDIVVAARATEDLGYDGFFRSDHYLAIFGDGMPGPTDAWTTLAGLARDTSRVRLGTLVTSVTFRLPGLLAVTVADVDRMSGGRVELGLGAGWFEAEHAAYGIPFPPLGERFDRLEEQLAVIRGIWSTPAGSTFDHDGPHHPVRGNPGLVSTMQDGGVPLIIGGSGRRRTPALAARYAAEFNAPFTAPDATRRLFERVDEACGEHRRDPATLIHSTAQVVCVGRDDAAVGRRAEAIGRDVDELRTGGVAGTFEEARDRLGRLAEVGTTRVYLQVLDLGDLDHLADVHEALSRI
jgi:F420-dependent oxidoreductase-like protein